MRLDELHPENRLVLAHFRARRGPGAAEAPIAAPDAHPDPYLEAGSHPDVVERVWDALGAALPADSRALVFGTPALVCPGAGVVLALAWGTAYALRVPDESIEEALELGCNAEREWSIGGRTNIVDELGRGWLFGCWADTEKRWLAQVFARTEATS